MLLELALVDLAMVMLFVRKYYVPSLKETHLIVKVPHCSLHNRDLIHLPFLQYGQRVFV